MSAPKRHPPQRQFTGGRSRFPDHGCRAWHAGRVKPIGRRQLLALASTGAMVACSPSTPTPRSSAPAGGPARTGVATGVPSASPTPRPRGPVPWQRLQRHLIGNLYRPGSARFDSIRLTENPRYDGRRPRAVVRVATAADVATVFAFAQHHDLPVAIRSGGHSYPGWSAGAGAVVIDLRGLDALTWRGTSVSVGAGAALAPVYAAVATRGRALGGGSCATVGISGLTLGGGVGVLTRSLGLTCDQLTSARIVTADGVLRTVGLRHEPDLFWSLRGGGGGHVGVVTELTFATAPAPEVNSFYRAWRFGDAARVIAAWQDWAPSADPRLWSTLKLLAGTTHPDGPLVMVSGTWTGRASAVDAQLSGLLRNTPRPVSSADHSRSFAAAMAAYAGCTDIATTSCHTGPGGALQREAFAATSHIAHRPLGPTGAADVVARVQAAQGSGLKEAGISIDALGGVVRDIDPGDTAFVHRRALATVQYTATWNTGTAGAAGAATDYVRGFRQAMLPHWGNHAYVNYADAAVRQPLHAYFGVNAERLHRVRQEYDPHGFFTQPQGW